MAYCWGMLVNGIAVYGRDPVLTCDYARFLALDQNCPFDHKSMPPMELDGGGLIQLFWREVVFWLGGNDEEDLRMDPPNWKNCSSSGYHP